MYSTSTYYVPGIDCGLERLTQRPSHFDQDMCAHAQMKRLKGLAQLDFSANRAREKKEVLL